MNTVLYTAVVILGLGNILLYYKIKKEKAAYDILNKEVKGYKSIFDALPFAVYVHSRLKFVFVNKTGAKIFGLEDPRQVIGKTLSDFIQVNMDVVGEERIKNALEDKPFEFLVEESLISKDGNIIGVEMLSMPMELEGKTVVLNLTRDANHVNELNNLKRKVNEEERRLKEVMEYDRLKTEFFSNLSHELRTPLALILGVIDLFEREWKENKFKEDDTSLNKKIKILRQNCYRLLKLVNNLIDMTKIDSGYFELELEACNIVNIVEDITMSCVEYIENRGIEIIFDTDTEEKIIACDPEKIERIILNILSNAIKFTPKGGSIAVNLFDKGEEVLISIKDTGIGMHKEKMSTIFNRFMQIDKSFTRNHEGSGIGLSLVKSLVEMHGGSIEVESEYGKGSEFTIHFPVGVLEATNKSIKENKNENYVERINIEFSDIYS